MKKFALIFALLFVLSVSVFAEGGIIHTGGKSCPEGQTCLTDGDIHTGGKTCPDSQTCSDDEGIIHTGGKSDNSVYKEIFDFLKLIFG